MTRNRVIPQMFDVRPVDRTGNLDWKKINGIEKVATAKDFVFEYNGQKNRESGNLKKSGESIADSQQKRINESIRKNRELEERVALLEAEISRKFEAEKKEKEERLAIEEALRKKEEARIAYQIEKNEDEKRRKIEEKNHREYLIKIQKKQALEEKIKKEREKKKIRFAEKQKKAQKKLEKKRLAAEMLSAKKKKKAALKKLRADERLERKMRKVMNPGYFTFGDLFDASGYWFSAGGKKVASAFVFGALIIAIGVGGISFAYKGIGVKGSVLGVSQQGYESFASAINAVSNQNFEGSAEKFTEAFERFSEASREMDQMGTLLNEGSRFFPYVSKLSSGKNILEVGKHFSLAGWHMNEVVKQVSRVKNPLSKESGFSFLELLRNTESSMREADKELRIASENIDKVKIDDLPEEMRGKFLLLREQLPQVLNLSDAFLKNSDIFSDLLGGNGPRKYLFLFQNNSEMRATGGFIGSYGLLDISNGHIRNFFIDGIFNPDGQLREKIVPPKPIQKISAAWSLHDSNWFPDFPSSAQEAILFYEKTGGPTVDGVITLTPVVLQKLLELTGPIEMAEYGVTLDSNNFVEKTQYEVEENYDREENEPKKILSDLAPLVLDRIVNSNDPEIILRSAQAFLDGLGEKHILIYSENKNLQNIISQKGWSGEVLEAKKDYLSVINTNINGFKTDAVIEEKISQRAEIAEDGSVVNTVSITRKHNGGNTDYDWWNRVNANYMRVYVPKGSELLSVEGQTREFNDPPLDYDKLGFKRNKKIQEEEGNMTIDEKTGTRIYEESGKTVFANWTYVSPQEEMTITYKYSLPFRLFPTMFNSGEKVDSYSLVAQKQSGSLGSDLVSEVIFPSSYAVKWTYPDYIKSEPGQIRLTGKLDTDKFVGVVFEKR